MFNQGGGARSRVEGAMRHAFKLVACAVLGAMAAALPVPASAQADSVAVGGKRREPVRVFLGKSETLRTHGNFVDIMIGDPEIADVVPLTDRSLSIHGKKIGGTRVSVYGEGKTLLSVFDIEVAYDTARLGEELAHRFPTARLKVTSVNGRILLSGSAPDAPTVERAVAMARQFGPEVINSIRVLRSQQVMLEVRFVEASRTAGRELGVNWNVEASGVAMNLGTSALLSGGEPFGTIVGTMLGRGIRADAMIRALEERGLARRLAEPNLVALSGDTASFLAGGEFPIPVQSNLGAITIEFKKFGVGLAFTPTVLDNGMINLKIEPEVSQLDPTNFVQVGNIRVPALIVRRANTTVELRDGQSFAIGGLLQTITTTDQSQLPWLGDVPVLGTLIRSANYQKRETDLAIIVTPRLVRPTKPGDTLRTPLDNTSPGNDADVFLLGRAEAKKTRQGQIPGDKRQIGHILNVDNGGANAAQR
jgi:pilus assembly protein CpaC